MILRTLLAGWLLAIYLFYARTVWQVDLGALGLGIIVGNGLFFVLTVTYMARRRKSRSSTNSNAVIGDHTKIGSVDDRTKWLKDTVGRTSTSVWVVNVSAFFCLNFYLAPPGIAAGALLVLHLACMIASLLTIWGVRFAKQRRRALPVLGAWSAGRPING